MHEAGGGEWLFDSSESPYTIWQLKIFSCSTGDDRRPFVAQIRHDHDRKALALALRSVDQADTEHCL